MIGLIVICVVRNWKGQGSMELLRIGIIRGFEGLGVGIRYFVWGVWGGSFIGGWWGGRGRSGGSIGGGGMFKELST